MRALQSPGVVGTEGRGAAEASAQEDSGVNPATQSQATLFLSGKVGPTTAALIGLHQGLLSPDLVGRIIAAQKRGARLGAAIDPRGKTLQQIVRNPAFDWGDGERVAGQATGGGEGGAAQALSGASGGNAPTTQVNQGEGSSGPPVQRKADGNGRAANTEALLAQASSSPGISLPEDIQRRFATRFGADVSGVRIHTGPESAAAAKGVAASAYTVGQDIHFGAGNYAPGSADGDRLIAHEVVHTMQQAGGTPAPQHKLEVSQPGDPAEVEADLIADNLTTSGSAPMGSPGISAAPSLSIQRTPTREARRRGRDAAESVEGSAEDVMARMVDPECIERTHALPEIVQNGGRSGGHPLDSDRERFQFMRAGREWFGDDDAIIEHFSQIERVEAARGDVYLHRDAKEALERAIAEVGGSDNAPRSTIAFAFRGDFTSETHFTGQSMHTLGYAVDYEVYDNPRIGRDETALLVDLVTGSPSHARLGSYEDRRPIIEEMGRQSAACAGEDSSPVTPPAGSSGAVLLDQVIQEVDRLSQTSQQFQSSLGDASEAFLSLRDEYVTALAMPQDNETNVAARDAAIAALVERAQPLITPWRAAVIDERARLTASPDDEDTRDRLAALDRLDQALRDPRFLFVKEGDRDADATSDSPPMAQLVDGGFCNQQSGYNAQFLQALVRNGFDIGAAWEGESTDLMHVELVVHRPTSEDRANDGEEEQAGERLLCDRGPGTAEQSAADEGRGGDGAAQDGEREGEWAFGQATVGELPDRDEGGTCPSDRGISPLGARGLAPPRMAAALVWYGIHQAELSQSDLDAIARFLCVPAVIDETFINAVARYQYEHHLRSTLTERLSDTVGTVGTQTRWWLSREGVDLADVGLRSARPSASEAGESQNQDEGQDLVESPNQEEVEGRSHDPGDPQAPSSGAGSRNGLQLGDGADIVSYRRGEATLAPGGVSRPEVGDRATVRSGNFEVTFQFVEHDGFHGWQAMGGEETLIDGRTYDALPGPDELLALGLSEGEVAASATRGYAHDGTRLNAYDAEYASLGYNQATLASGKAQKIVGKALYVAPRQIRAGMEDLVEALSSAGIWLESHDGEWHIGCDDDLLGRCEPKQEPVLADFEALCAGGRMGMGNDGDAQRYHDRYYDAGDDEFDGPDPRASLAIGTDLQKLGMLTGIFADSRVQAAAVLTYAEDQLVDTENIQVREDDPRSAKVGDFPLSTEVMGMLGQATNSGTRHGREVVWNAWKGVSEKSAEEGFDWTQVYDPARWASAAGERYNDAILAEMADHPTNRGGRRANDWREEWLVEARNQYGPEYGQGPFGHGSGGRWDALATEFGAEGGARSEPAPGEAVTQD